MGHKRWRRREPHAPVPRAPRRLEATRRRFRERAAQQARIAQISPRGEDDEQERALRR
jgi:hypothetical protein